MFLNARLTGPGQTFLGASNTNQGLKIRFLVSAPEFLVTAAWTVPAASALSNVPSVHLSDQPVPLTGPGSLTPPARETPGRPRTAATPVPDHSAGPGIGRRRLVAEEGTASPEVTIQGRIQATATP